MRAQQYKVLNVPNYDWEKTVKGSPHRIEAGTRKYMGYEQSGYVPTSIALVGPKITAETTLDTTYVPDGKKRSQIKNDAIMEAVEVVKSGQKRESKPRTFKLSKRDELITEGLTTGKEEFMAKRQQKLNEKVAKEPEMIKKRQEKITKNDKLNRKRQVNRLNKERAADEKDLAVINDTTPDVIRQWHKLGSKEMAEQALAARRQNYGRTAQITPDLTKRLKKVDNIDSYWATKKQLKTNARAAMKHDRIITAFNSKFLLTEYIPADVKLTEEQQDRIVNKKGYYKLKIIELFDPEAVPKTNKALDDFAAQNKLTRKQFLPKNMTP